MSSGNEIKPPISESPLSPLERLQLMVPGFRGYKVKDLIRQDDFLVRKTAASMLEEALGFIERAEEEVARNNPFDPLIQQYETVLSDLRSLIAEVWGSPTGDAGMHDRFKVFPENLERLVEYDLKLVDTAKAILDSAKARANPQVIDSMIRDARTYVIERQKLLIPEKLGRKW
ncbi:hypothetical protein [Vulcanisaeta distributa]|uniref:Uncharacterized protein n=1 Tax=Vulcanisaeta distributa (strain DSM 14429 / JCM 11212 / NBRC 100878 / IC-017) TaxID=572478 RepID=E1QTF2_VULDI|nr:hypothetical protein [Vulcanisaeta distributa]ADN50945.1 conserved hypothetical protein [Vulcanisaeta distributa DSM 14429]